MTDPNAKKEQETPKPGRPRDPQVDRAILQATLRVLTDQGYAGMSIERVAAAAGVGKTAIYRRFSSKEVVGGRRISVRSRELGTAAGYGQRAR